MSDRRFTPFDRVPEFDRDPRARTGLLQLLSIATRASGRDDSEYWGYVMREHGGGMTPDGERDMVALGTRFRTTTEPQSGLAVARSLGIIGEAEVPITTHSPVAVAHLSVDVFDDPRRPKNPRAMLWAGYELSTHPTDQESVGLVVNLEITPHSKPFPLPVEFEEAWDDLSLGSLLPCPQEGPLNDTQFDGRAEHIHALAKYMLRGFA